ncbi:hypothetical protein D1007_60218 [Hordeum vulgare]|nr:hypothetical protein D1007_60218 [Hordeum vulgare]
MRLYLHDHDGSLSKKRKVPDYHLEDAMTIFLYFSPLDTWAKEALKPTDQPIGIEGATDKANGVSHMNGALGIPDKHGVAKLWCKYDTDG